MKKFTKNIAKEFKNSFGRFLAIMAIIALGVGFLIGISQSTPDMKTSMSDYLTENAAYDVDVKATYGLTQTDIDEIASLTTTDGDDVVADYMPAVTSSVMANIDGLYQPFGGEPHRHRFFCGKRRRARRQEHISELSHSGRGQIPADGFRGSGGAPQQLFC